MGNVYKKSIFLEMILNNELTQLHLDLTKTWLEYSKEEKIIKNYTISTLSHQYQLEKINNLYQKLLNYEQAIKDIKNKDEEQFYNF